MPTVPLLPAALPHPALPHPYLDLLHFHLVLPLEIQQCLLVLQVVVGDGCG